MATTTPPPRSNTATATSNATATTTPVATPVTSPVSTSTSSSASSPKPPATTGRAVTPVTPVTLPGWVGPRLLVPIVVEAMVVTPKSTQGPGSAPWAETRIDVPMDAQGYLNPPPDPKLPAEFGVRTDLRPVGIHLHWALPDGLTRGRTGDADPSVLNQVKAPQPLVIGADLPSSGPDHPEVKATAGTLRTPLSSAQASASITPDQARFALIPDRWLVLRMQSDPNPPNVRRVVGWVIEVNDRIDPRVGKYRLVTRVTPLDKWQGEAPDDRLERWYTPLGKGDAAFVAYYDNVQNVLGFYDDLKVQAPSAGPLSYLVAGWYSRPTDDPAYDPTGRGWQTELKEAKGSFGPTDAFKTCLEALKQDLGFKLATSGEQALMARLQWEQRKGIDSSAQSARTGFANLLCHGQVYNVPWTSTGQIPFGIPSTSGLAVAVGNSSAEALAAALAVGMKVDALEPLLASLQLGQLPTLAAPDGLAQLEALLHAQSFSSRSGGAVWVDCGEVAHRMKDTLATAGSGGSSITATSAPTSTPLPHTWKLQPRPRFFQPADPVLVLLGAGRSYKHGADGRFESDGALCCRISGQTLVALPIPVSRVSSDYVDPTRHQVRPDQPIPEDYLRSLDIIAQPAANFLSSEPFLALPTLKGLPNEVYDLVVEAMLIDEAQVSPMAARLFDWCRSSKQVNVQKVVARAYDLEPMLRYAQQQWRQGGVDLTSSAKEVAFWPAEARTFIENQVAPSPVGVQIWRAPWTPLHLEWSVTYIPTPGQVSDWTLTEHDYLLHSGFTPASSGLSLKGRSLLTPGPARSLQSALKQLLEQERSGDQDLMAANKEAQLEDTLRSLEAFDVLSASLGDFHEKIGPLVGKLWRAGHLTLTQLRVVDAFGQYLTVPPNVLSAPLRAEAVAPWTLAATSNATPVLLNGPGFIQLPPRLFDPARLMFRLLDAADTTGNADAALELEHGPIAGWILPDHLDEALEIYDRQGRSLGQFQTPPQGWGVEWQAAPGDNSGARPSTADNHPAVRGLYSGLMYHGSVDRRRQDPTYAARIPEGPVSEPVLSAFLRMIDATRWTIDPVGPGEENSLAMLAGHPLALVRASLLLEMPATAASRTAGQRFPVRLGDLTRLQDGLIGYFIDDAQQSDLAYRTFYPVHESLANEAPLLGPNQTYFGQVSRRDSTSSLFQKQAIQHPFISTAPFVMLEPNKRVTLTLVIDPRGGVHATSGFLPRKRIDLHKEHIGKALEQMVFSFRVAPVLVNRRAPRLPVPGGEALGWKWVARPGVGQWQEQPLLASDEEARFSSGPAVLVEGWLRRGPKAEGR